MCWSKDTSLDLKSFAAFFTEDRHADELAYHDALWSCLRHLKAQDNPASAQADQTAGEIESPDFAFSLFGTAFFVVGIGPHAPRFSRRTAFPGLVLNPHAQFERLRSIGAMPRMEHASRVKDTRLQGGANPLLGKHGERSAAWQYSGVPVKQLPDWDET